MAPSQQAGLNPECSVRTSNTAKRMETACGRPVSTLAPRISAALQPAGRRRVTRAAAHQPPVPKTGHTIQLGEERKAHGRLKVGGTCVLQDALLQARRGLQGDGVQVARLCAAQELLIHAPARARALRPGSCAAAADQFGRKAAKQDQHVLGMLLLLEGPAQQLRTGPVPAYQVKGRSKRSPRRFWSSSRPVRARHARPEEGAPRGSGQAGP